MLFVRIQCLSAVFILLSSWGLSRNRRPVILLRRASTVFVFILLQACRTCFRTCFRICFCAVRLFSTASQILVHVSELLLPSKDDDAWSGVLCEVTSLQCGEVGGASDAVLFIFTFVLHLLELGLGNGRLPVIRTGTILIKITAFAKTQPIEVRIGSTTCTCSSSRTQRRGTR